MMLGLALMRKSTLWQSKQIGNQHTMDPMADSDSSNKINKFYKYKNILKSSPYKSQ